MKKNIMCVILAVIIFCLFGCGGSGNGGVAGGGGENSNSTATPADVQSPQAAEEETTTNPLPSFKTSIIPLESKLINALTGDSIQTQASNENKVTLTIAAESLAVDTNVAVGSVDNPPALPIGLNFVGPTYDFGPDGMSFNKSGTVEISFTEEDLQAAGVVSKSSLKIYSFDKTSKEWSEVRVISIDTTKNIVVGEVNHFSFYALVGLSGMPPEDLGTPQPGDLLFKLTFDNESKMVGWVPGHVGIFTGEKEWNGKGLATDFVKFFGKYNAVESMIRVGVRYAYYNIPNSIESYLISALFEDDSVYMGARELIDGNLSYEQRLKIVEFIENQIGKPYLNLKDAYGLTTGKNVKGPERFNCVGLAEAAYEYAGVNNGDGILSNDDNELLTPAKMYAQTKPAKGKTVKPVIEWATLSPDHGTTQTEMLAQIAVSHEYGLGYIDSVTYKTDVGYIDPNIPINDEGIYGDIEAGDGVYSAKAQVGGKQSDGILGLNFIVTDKSGKSVTVRREFRYVIDVLVPINYVSKKLAMKKWVK